MLRKVNATNFLAQSEQASLACNEKLSFMKKDSLTDKINVGSLVLAKGNIRGNVESIEEGLCTIIDFSGKTHVYDLTDVKKLKAEIEY